jgi:hypothetical protein
MLFRSRRSRGLAIAVAIVLLFGTFSALGLSAAKQVAGVTVDTSSALAVTAASGFKFVSPTYEQLPTNTTIQVSFTNGDPNSPHTFSLLKREGYVIKSSDSLLGLFHAYGNFTNLSLNPSAQTTSSFTSPGPGWYEFVCLEPGHFAEGMYGFVAFGMNLPGNLTVGSGASGPGAGVFIISGTIVSLVVIALVLGFVVGQRRGGEHEMPPERLGYPEPTTAGPESPAPMPSEAPKG